MTGYGYCRTGKEGVSFFIEIKSLNSKFLDIFLKLPEGMTFLEDRIKEVIQQKFDRGRISLSIIEEQYSGKVLSVDIAQARKYHNAFKKLKEKLDISGEIDIGLFRDIPHIFRTGKEGYSLSVIWPALKKGIEKAVLMLEVSRNKEGRKIQRALAKHAAGISAAVLKIEEHAPEAVKFHKEKLEHTLKEFLPELNLNSPRLVEELTLFASRVDISEEMMRLKAHLQSFLGTLELSGSVGRRLDFIAQEMSREINTLSSKANSYAVSSQSVLVKEELEKIREQVQNVE